MYCSVKKGGRSLQASVCCTVLYLITASNCASSRWASYTGTKGTNEYDPQFIAQINRKSLRCNAKSNEVCGITYLANIPTLGRDISAWEMRRGEGSRGVQGTG